MKSPTEIYFSGVCYTPFQILLHDVPWWRGLQGGEGWFGHRWEQVQWYSATCYPPAPHPPLRKVKLFCKKSPTKINFLLSASPHLNFFCRLDLEDMKNLRRCAICKEWKDKKSINRHVKLVHSTSQEKCDHWPLWFSSRHNRKASGTRCKSPHLRCSRSLWVLW